MDKAEFDKVYEQLTPRECEVVLELLAEKTDEEIADSLNISKATVRKHIENIVKKYYFPEKERSYKRPLLVMLFAKHRPDLFNNSVPDTRNEPEVSTPPSQDSREMVDMGGQRPTQSGTLCFVRDEWAIAHSPEDSVGGELKITSPINGIPKVIRTISIPLAKVDVGGAISML